MLSSVGSADRRACQLPAAVERELSQLEERHGQRAEPQAQHRLAGLGEAAAVLVLKKIGASKQPVKNLSAYIHWMANHNASQGTACASGSSKQGESALGPMNHHAGVRTEDEPAVSPARPVPLYSHGSPFRLHTDSTTRQLSPLADHAMMQVGSPAQKTVCSPPRTFSIPSLVRDITKRLWQTVVLGVQTLSTLACALRRTASPQMLALGELQFDKVFLIYVYLAGNKIEDLPELDEKYIRSLLSIPVEEFENDIWKKFGHKFIGDTDRRKNLDWDPSKASVYHCSIEKTDDSVVTIFKGPYREKTRNKLQKVVGDDNVLIVTFADIPGNRSIDAYYSIYRQFVEDGIILASRRYRFLTYKDGGKEGKIKKEGNQIFSSSVKCYFVRTESGWDRNEPYILSTRTMDEVRNMFMHIHTVPTVAKYVSRFGLVLSKTTTLLDANDLSSVEVITIDDVPCKDKNGKVIINHGEALIHTDGTGFISQDLAQNCPSGVFKGNLSRTNDLQPLLMQVRLFYDGLAVKGTLLVDKRLPSRTIKIRPSMIKVKSDPHLLDGQSFNSLEIVTTSNRPKRAYTNKFLITLLHYGGVPVDYFLELIGKARKDVEKARYNTRDSLEVAYNHDYKDDSMSARMILSGIKPEDDAYLQYQLSKMRQEEREGMKVGRIPIDESYYLMGTTDPTGTLKPNEVCVIHENGQISGDVLVYRNPGLHFGDIHVLTATYIPDLDKIVGFSKYGIFFPISGPRSLAGEIANGDCDGDMYFVSKNPQLLEHYKPSEAWVQRNPPKTTDQKNPQEFNGPELERILFLEYLQTRFTPSYAKSTAADCWLVHMDRLLTGDVQQTKEEREIIMAKMLDLVDIYYEALDASKTGNKIDVPHALRVKDQYPHYMERERSRSYHSESVLGKIYDEAKSMSEQSENITPVDISVLTCFTEEVVSKECREQWASRYMDYRRESSALYDEKYSNEERNARFPEIYQKYRRMLYHADEFHQSPRNCREVFGEACVIYQIVYEHARQWKKVRLCGFVWKVAGPALCELHAIKCGGETVLCSQAVLQDAFKKNR